MNLSEHARMMDRIGDLKARQAELEEALCFECAESIALCECPGGFYLGDPPTLQQRIFDWGRETFGAGQRSEGVYAHLVREIKELGDYLNDGEELADCTILLLELAGFAGVNLLDEVEKKHQINRGRKWGDIEPDGSILHIKDGE